MAKTVYKREARREKCANLKLKLDLLHAKKAIITCSAQKASIHDSDRFME